MWFELVKKNSIMASLKSVLRINKLFRVDSIQLDGKENLLTGKPKIILANHPKATDSFVIWFMVPISFFSIRVHSHLGMRMFNRNTTGRWQVRGNCFVHVGNPIFAPPESGFESTYRFLRHLTDNVIAEISNLVKQATENANG